MARYQYGFCDVLCVPYTICTCSHRCQQLYLKESMRHAAHVNAEVHAQDDLIFNEQHLDRPASTGEELIQP